MNWCKGKENYFIQYIDVYFESLSFFFFFFLKYTYSIHLCFTGVALVDVGDAMRELGEVKDALDMEVKQNFIDPLQNIYDKDLKEIQVRYNKLLH